MNDTHWQQQLAESVQSVDQLCQHLGLSPDQLPALAELTDFPLRVPLSFVRRMRSGDPDDPLLKQILPIADELKPVAGFGVDPVGDLAAAVGNGVLHKYHGRALIVVTGACAVHCRYCFRRHFPYGELQLSTQKIEQALDYIARDSSIHEVLLSGGDPLLLSYDKLHRLCSQLSALPHVRRLRIHSRIPVVLPARINAALVSMLENLSKPLVMVMHANHPREINQEVTEAVSALRSANIMVLNQSVLLRGVNDQADTLVELSEGLFAAGVLPYYLHTLDPTQGTAHFDVDKVSAKQLHAQLQQRLPGYLVPKLVYEQAGAQHKILL